MSANPHEHILRVEGKVSALINASLYSGIEIDVPKTETCASQIQSAALVPVAQAFAQNSRDILGMLSLAHAFLSRGISLGYTVGMEASAIPEGTHLTAAQGRELSEKLIESWSKQVEDPEMRKAIYGAADAEIEHLFRESSRLSSYFNSLLRAATVSAWTMFECLAQDGWTVARNVLNPGLEDNRRFRTVQKVAGAYLTLFGCDSTLDGILANSHLGVLEADRHLIVHRGGIVDQLHLDTTHQGLRLREPLPLDGRRVSRSTNVSISCGCNLLSFVDHRLQTR